MTAPHQGLSMLGSAAELVHLYLFGHCYNLLLGVLLLIAKKKEHTQANHGSQEESEGYVEQSCLEQAP